MATKGKDPLLKALREIEGFAPACSKEAVALTETTKEAGLEVHTWRDAVLNLQRIARKALREAGARRLMVAYSFQRQFVDPIRSGRKTHTMRPQRKRHARIGEPVQLYCGMRTRGCFKILECDPVCIDVAPILLGPWGIEIGGVQIREYEKRNEYALTDGFDSWRQLRRFFIRAYGPGTWEGVLVKWESA